MLQELLIQKKRYKLRARRFNYYDFYKDQLDVVNEIKQGRKDRKKNIKPAVQVEAH
jgi:hypothetical protein